MKIKMIHPVSDFWGQVPADPKEALKWIERAGRTCYRSEDKITDGSAVKFCQNILNRGHMSVLEHSQLVFQADYDVYANIPAPSIFIKKLTHARHVYFAGSLRAWIEVLRDFIGLPTELSTPHTNACYWRSVASEMKLHFPFINFKEGIPKPFDIKLITNQELIPKQLRRYTVKFTTDRGVTHELVRHRPFAAFSQESTRYVEYGGKFDFTFIIPPWRDITEGCYGWKEADLFMGTLLYCSKSYKELRGMGERPEQARQVLPNALKTDIVTTADEAEWWHIFHMRCNKTAHPSIRQIMEPIQTIFNEMADK